ncbi:MAG: hypothetical protein K0S41_1101 [Anaerocolumna sp.]|nr:hypothetical protein [Anaerocolumna sp.]
MFKKLLLYILITSCCFINVSCGVRSQSSDSTVDGTTMSIEPSMTMESSTSTEPSTSMEPSKSVEPPMAPIDTTTSNDMIEIIEENLDIVTMTPSTDISQTDNLVESNITCLQDKKHNVFFGTIGNKEIRMDIYPDGNNITAFYVAKNSEDEIKLVGNLDGFEISLSDDSKNMLIGTVTSRDEPGELKGTLTLSNGEPLSVALKMGHVCGDNLDNFYEMLDTNNQEVDTFLTKLKKDVISADKQAIADYIYYPMKVLIDGKEITINSSQEFIDNYNKIMNDDFVNAISTAFTKYAFHNASGIMFGDYTLNFWIYKMDSEFKIIGINNENITNLDTASIPKNTSEPFVGIMELDGETEKFFYGTWEGEKLLGFANSWNDASEYPTGQKVIGDEIVISKNTFSSKGFENYHDYQYKLKNPVYEITTICYNSDSFYREFKIDLPDLNIDDEIKHIRVSSYKKFTIPVSFIVVNNDRLILLLEATCFELKRVDDVKD